VGDLTATTLTATNALTGSSISYPTSDGTNGQVLTTNGSGTLSFSDIPAGYSDSDARSAISVSGDLSYNSSTGVISYSDSDTTYTDSDARSAISVSGNLAYNSSTGVISYSEPTMYADSDARSAISAGTGISYDSSTGVITNTVSNTDTTYSAGTGLTLTGTTFSNNITQYTDSDVGTYLSSNGYATQSTIVAAITDSAPATLDTLNELAAALGDDANFSTTVTNSIALKAPLASPSFTGNIDTAGNTITVDPSSGDAVLFLQGAAGAQTLRVDQNSIRTTTSNAFSIFTDGNTRQLYLNSNGLVGINQGLETPLSALDIIGSGYEQIRIGSNKTDNTNKTAGIVSTMYTNNSVSFMQGFFQNGNNAVYYGSADGAHRGLQRHYFYVNDNYNATTGHTLAMQVSSGSTTALVVNGNNSTGGTVNWTSTKGSNESHAHYGTNGDWYIRPASNSGNVYVKNYQAESDQRLKENIEDITYGTAEILQLQPRKFNWIGESVEQNGFVAQEVESVLPAFVKTSEMKINEDDAEGIKSVDYNSIVATLVNTIQELEARIATLESE
jgi:hypothetical protein